MCANSYACCGMVSDPCKQDKDPGPCKGFFPRYYYDYKSKKCVEFIYGGCKGNSNNFKTLEECEKTCKPEGKHSIPFLDIIQMYAMAVMREQYLVWCYYCSQHGCCSC